MRATASRARRRSPALLVSATIVGVIVALLLLTPAVLDQLARLRRSDWSLENNVGQAYGGLAAVLGTLALVGVSASLILQARDNALNREQMHRQFHNELMFKAIDDPELLTSWGDVGPQDFDPARKHMYTNLIVSFWSTMYSLGRLPEVELREAAYGMFSGTVGRGYWDAAASLRHSIAVSKRDARFVAILDQEYERARIAPASTGAPTDGAASASSPAADPGRRGTSSVTSFMALAAAVGLAGAVLNHRRRFRQQAESSIPCPFGHGTR